MDTGHPRWGRAEGTHKQQQTLVLTDSPAAAQEAEQEKQAPHGQEDVGARDQQGVGGHDLPEAGGVYQDPDADGQQAGPAQLLSGPVRREKEEADMEVRHSTRSIPSPTQRGPWWSR